MPYVDTHCHLDHHEQLDAATQVSRAREAGALALVTVGTDMASSTQCVRTAQRFDDVYAAVGIHPNDAMEATDQVLDVIDRLADEDAVVAIGETGLDYYWDHTTPEQQEAAFRAHVELARAHDLALVIHCREAWDDCLRVLADAGPPDRVIMHCFSGDAEVVRRCAQAGWFMSFAGNVTFKNARSLRAAAAEVPLELLLSETDAPFLTPHPHRGKPNDPSYVPITLATLAEVQGRSVAEIERATVDNAARVFDAPEMAGEATS